MAGPTHVAGPDACPMRAESGDSVIVRGQALVQIGRPRDEAVWPVDRRANEVT